MTRDVRRSMCKARIEGFLGVRRRDIIEKYQARQYKYPEVSKFLRLLGINNFFGLVLLHLHIGDWLFEETV